MGLTVRELITKIGFKTDSASIKRAEARIQKFKRFSKFAVAGIITAIGAIGIASIKAASDMEMLTTQFEVMLGSAEKANALMEELKTFAATTPFQLQDVAQGTQTLLSFGVAQQDVIQTMRMLGDTASGNREKLNGLILAYGKVQTKGKVSMEEINMIAERGVPIIGTLVKQLGVTEKQFFKLVSAGKIGRKEIKQAFVTMTSEGGMFFKGMEKQSLTFAGLVSTMKDNLMLMAAALGNTLLPAAKSLIMTLTELIRGPLGDIIRSIAEGLVPVLETIGPLIGMLLKALKPIIDAVLKLLAPILEALGPIIEGVVMVLEPLTRIIGVVINLLTPVFQILKALTPVFKLISTVVGIVAKVLETLEPVLSEIIGLWVEMLSIILELLATSLIEVFEELEPTLVELALILADILKMAMPLIRLFTKFFAKTLAGGLKIVVPLLKVVFKILETIFKVLRPIINAIGNFLVPILEKVFKFFMDIFSTIQEFVGEVIGAVVGAIDKLITWVNKIPGINIKKPKVGPDLASEITKKQIEKDQRVTNLKQTNQISVTAPMGAPGVTGLTPDGVASTMKQAMRATFNLELKKILIAAR